MGAERRFPPAVSAAAAVGRQPRRIFRFLDLACRQGERLHGSVGLGGLEAVAMQFEEEDGHGKADSLVAVEERMGFDESEAVARCQLEDGRLAIRDEILRTRQCRVEEPLVT